MMSATKSVGSGIGEGDSSDDIEDVYELTPLQQGILLHSMYGGDADTYIAQNSYQIDGALDVAALLEAWRRTTIAHHSLRTSFHWGRLDKPLQVVHRDPAVQVHQHDWSDLDQQEQEVWFDRLLTEDRQAGFFSLSHPPLQRLHLIRLGEEQYRLIWTHHMLLLDGWSELIVMNDVVARYRQLTTNGPVPPAATPYRDYIAWLQRQDLDAAKEFWSATLGGGSSASPLGPLLPLEQGRKAGPVTEQVAPLPLSLVASLRAVAARHQVTFSTLVQAAWALLLQRYTGEAEVTFGCASSGRPAELAGVDQMVGSFINSLPVRVAVPDDGDLGEWLRDIQGRLSAVRRYEYSPLAQVKTWIGASGPEPLFDSLIVQNNYPSEIELGEAGHRLTIRLINAFEKTSEPLTLKVYAEPRPAVRIIFHRERFEPSAAEAIMADFQAALQGLCEAGRVAEAARALQSTGKDDAGGAVDFPDAGCTLAELVERQATATPDALALLAGQERTTFGDLFRRALAVAGALEAAGTGPGQVVGVCTERSPEMVAGILGVLLAGAAYLPLEPSLPKSRLLFMVQNADARVVLTQRACSETAEACAPGRVLILEDLRDAAPGRPVAGPRPEDAAYVIYTSGSTGQPKGVVVTHRAIVNRLLWMQETFHLTRADRVLQKTPFGFDVSVWELFLPLITGAGLVLARPGGHQDAEYLARTIGESEVTIAHFVPSMLQLFLEEPAAPRLPRLRRVLCSGEQLSYPLATRFKELMPETELHNLYGPTEAAVDVTWWDCRRPAPPGLVPIGHPIANTQAYVLDRRLAEAPPGVPGELYLGGVQLARGYVSRPGQTAATFIAHPLAGPGGRLYRTGDRARRLSDGSLEFLGRLDHQVKIRGYRIELGEIEQSLLAYPAVREATVGVVDGAVGPRLAAYVTGAQESEVEDLREHLRARLPRYMIPATIMVLPSLPLTRNGKLDRAALPRPVSASTSDPGQVVPATPTEERVAAAFREILGLEEEFDLTDSFFDLGGDSFAAVRTVRRIEGATVAMLAVHQSVRELAAEIDKPSRLGGLLVPLNSVSEASHTLVCVPFGGGSAITFRPLADSVGDDVALLAVSIPGHELGHELEEYPDLVPMQEVAQACVDEILAGTDGPVAVYGHCVGTAMAVEIARRLELAGRPVERLFIGAAFPFYEPRLIEGMFLRRATAAADEAEIRYMKSLGGFSGTMGDEEMAFVMRAFRHDLDEGRRYFAEQWPRRRAVQPLATEITFVAGTADPETTHYQRRYRIWDRFSPSVELAEVPGGGHYFMQHQPDDLGRIIRTALSRSQVEARPSAGE